MVDDAVLDTKRRKRRVDGRALNGIRRAIAAALEDEQQDTALLQRYNKEGLNYSALGASLGISRQRATTLVNRAIIRSLMLEEFRNGKELTELSRRYHNLYPRKADDAR